MSASCNVLLISPRFVEQSFWSFRSACEIYGARYPTAPLGLITVAAMLPSSWNCRLIDRNTAELTDADLDWADLVMTGGMLPQRPDMQAVIDLVQARGKPVVVGGPDVTSVPHAYARADFQVLGEAEGVIDAFIAAWNSGARSGVFEAEKFKIDVTKTPIPRYDLLKREHYGYYGVQFARGCPFNCEFCDIIELYGRVPRVKTVEQILRELQALYAVGYRGHLDFVDDNFIGNKKAVKAFLPHLIAWQKQRGYPFEFSTEASLNLADDDALLALMREARFFAVFVGIESPDTGTLVSMQKKQNTRRVLAESVHKIYRAGMWVTAGFIVGFDTEKDGIAEAMIDCIEATAIPVCMVSMLWALPNTQLTRRLEREGRLFPESYTGRRWGGACTSGLNFVTKRRRGEILADYQKILRAIYPPAAYFARVRTLIRMLGQPAPGQLKTALDAPREAASGHPASEPLGGAPAGPQLGSISRLELVELWRLVWRLAVRQPRALVHFGRALYLAARTNPGALTTVGLLAALYLHLGPFSRYVMAMLDKDIEIADSDEFRTLSPLPPGAAAPAQPTAAAAESLVLH